jgi:HSP20 family molecular chaperone IbpA
MLASINSNLKIIGGLLLSAAVWQSYMLYDLKSDINCQGDLVKEDPFMRTLITNSSAKKLEFDNFLYKPLLDMYVDNDKYIIKTDIPGVKKSDINIKVDSGILIIKAELEEFKEGNSSEFISKERYMKKYLRNISLAEDADIFNVKSEYRDGVLTISIPKKK